MDTAKEIEQLATEFEQCRKILPALGDENRLIYRDLQCLIIFRS